VATRYRDSQERGNVKKTRDWSGQNGDASCAPHQSLWKAQGLTAPRETDTQPGWGLDQSRFTMPGAANPGRRPRRAVSRCCGSGRSQLWLPVGDPGADSSGKYSASGAGRVSEATGSGVGHTGRRRRRSAGRRAGQRIQEPAGVETLSRIRCRRISGARIGLSQRTRPWLTPGPGSFSRAARYLDGAAPAAGIGRSLMLRNAIEP
jgi:hypothetical protein